MSQPPSTDSVRLPVTRDAVKVKNTFIEFNELSPAMLQVRPVKSTPGYRFGKPAFDIDEDDDSPSVAVGGVISTKSYAADPLSPMQGTLTGDSEGSIMFKDEPCKIEASASLRGGRLWPHREDGDDAAEGDEPTRVKGVDDVPGSSLRIASVRYDADGDPMPHKAASVMSMRSIRFDDPSETPTATIPPPKYIDDGKQDGEVVGLRSSVKPVKSSKSIRKKKSKKRAQMPSPVHVQTKHGFVHFDEDGKTPLVGHSLTMPAAVMAGRADEESGSEYTDETDSSEGEYDDGESNISTEDADAELVVWRGIGLDRNSFLPQDEMEGQDAMRLSTLLCCRKADGQLANLGARMHALGRCVPCLMQCRFVGGRCKEPCRFGLLCNRCHEPHSEEELQKIQTQMRRLRKQKNNNQRPS